MEAAMMEYYRNNRNTTPEQTANKIADIAVMCQAYGIKKTFFIITGLQKNYYLNGKVTPINFNRFCFDR